MDDGDFLDVEGKVAHPCDLLCCRYTTNGEGIMTGTSEGVLRKIGGANLKMLSMYKDTELDKKSSPITNIVFSTFSNLCVVSYVHGYLKLWDIEKGKCERTITEENQILGCGVSPHKPVIMSCTDTSILSLYDEETGNLIRTFDRSVGPVADGHSSRVFSAKFHPHNPNEVVTGGWDNTVQIWDLREPKSIRRFIGPHICGDGLDIDSSGHQLLTASCNADKNLLIWNYSMGKVLVDLTLDKAKNYCGRFFYDRYTITASAEPATLRIIEVNELNTSGIYRSNQSGLFNVDFYSPPSSNRRATAVLHLVTVGGKYLMKLKFSYKKT